MKSIACVVLAAAATLQGCESMSGWRGRVGAGGGLSTLRARDNGQSENVEGSQFSLRAELAQPIEYLDGMEVGLRVRGGVREVDDEFGGDVYELESSQLALLPTVRGNFGLSNSSRLYGEVFGGYEHFWADERLGAATGSLNDGGVSYGAGLGLEFDVSVASALFFGLEWSRHDTKNFGANVAFEDYSGVVGLAFRF
jgi:hypothetical protein